MPDKGHRSTNGDDECLHGLDARWCSICIHGVTKPEPAPTIISTFRARFEGQCRRCDLPIALGSVIHRLSNETYVHEGCQP